VYGINSLFAYRESQPYTLSKKYNQLICKDCQNISYDYAYYPPITGQVANNIEWLIDSSVKYVISANERINSTHFKLLDTYLYPSITSFYDKTDVGMIYLYEFIEAKPISSVDFGHSRIKSISVNSFLVDFYNVKNLKLDLAFLFSDNYKAYFNGEKIDVTSNPEGYIRISLPSQTGTIEVKYERYFSFIGFIGYVIFFLIIRCCTSSITNLFRYSRRKLIK
jgi:hypothetical protein